MLWQAPTSPVAALVLAHGAGAGMRHRNMQALADAFADAGIATLRFDFPFIAEGRSRVDPPVVATAAIAQACVAARERSDLPLWVGGHSFGGRMATHAVLDHPIAPRGLVLCSFPLHPAGRPGTARAAHLARIDLPTLFLSGTRDALAEPSLLAQVVATLPAATLHWLDTADHGYRTLARSRVAAENVFAEIARVTRAFIDAHS